MSNLLRRRGTVWDEVPSSLAPLNPDARPLGTYKTKMATRTGKRSILTIWRTLCKTSDRSFVRHFNRFVSKRKRRVVVEQTLE